MGGWKKFSSGERACPARRTCSYTRETSLAEGGALSHAVVLGHTPGCDTAEAVPHQGET